VAEPGQGVERTVAHHLVLR